MLNTTLNTSILASGRNVHFNIYGPPVVARPLLFICVGILVCGAKQPVLLLASMMLCA